MRKLLSLTLVVTTLGLAPVAKAMSASSAIKKVFGNSRVAHCIAYRESTNRPTATHHNSNGTVDFGLYQINSSWFGKVVRYRGRFKYVQRRWILNPVYNAEVAWIISRGGSNWGPWTTRGYC